MSEDFALQSLRFLLNEMSPAERDVFDKRLQDHPSDCALFKAYADAVAAHAERETREGRELSVERALLLLGKVEHELQGQRPTGAEGKGDWKRSFWPVAAAVLLAFNLWQLALSIHNSNTTQGATPKGEWAEKAGSERKDGHAAPTNSFRGEVPAIREAEELRRRASELAILTERHEQLRAECEALQGIKDGLSAESHRIVMRLRTLSVSDSAGNSLAAMELVTPAKYASGERKGVMEAAKKILNMAGDVTKTGNGGAAAVDNGESRLGGNGATTTSTSSGINSSSTAGAVSTTGSSTAAPNSGGQSLRGSEESLIVLGAIMQSPTTSAGATAAAEPYAWTVMDGTNSEGCVNFYNLPLVAAGEAMVLWTKSPGPETSFVRVGTLPGVLAGKSGNVFFKAADGSMPVEILVTKESTGEVPKVPSGKVVLRGP